MRKAGLLFNTQKTDAVEKAQQLLNWGGENNISFLLPEDEAATLGVSGLAHDAWANGVEFAVVLGGDGTFLRAARKTFGRNIPLYGINLGRLGFLATGSPESAESDILTIMKGGHTLQKRHLIKGVLRRNGKAVHEIYALNDIVISKRSLARAIDLEVRATGELLTLFIGDGLIISTPTGSTGYALSAGGPILPPHIPCLLLAPICSHSLSTRPIIFGQTDKISILPRGDLGNVVVTQDGQLSYKLMDGDELEAGLDSDMFVNTIRLKGDNYYELLRKKLRWGYNSIDDGRKTV